MSKPLQIGITGGIGSGKSLVCKIFATLGVPVYDADHHAKSLMTTDGILVSQIKKEFGDLAYHPDGSLNRTYLAQFVFSNEERLNVMNSLVHPRVGVDYDKWVSSQPHAVYVLKEAALLYESGSWRQLDRIIVVSAPVDVREQRVLQRDIHRSSDQFRDIVSRQMPEEEKLSRADYVIINDDIKPVLPQVLRLHSLFNSTAGELKKSARG